MVKINFLDENKKINVIDAKDGSSLLEVAKKNNVNLEGTCGGEMLCSTCHVYILSEHIDNLNKQTIEEKEILALTKNLKKNSRLACQIKITNILKGLIFSIA